MNIVLDGKDLEVRAYLAAQIGPSRRPFGAVRPFPVLASTSTQLAANRSGEDILFVSVVCNAASLAALAKNQSPSLNQDVTYQFSATISVFADFVLFPGEELFVTSSINATFIVTQVPFGPSS